MRLRSAKCERAALRNTAASSTLRLQQLRLNTTFRGTSTSSDRQPAASGWANPGILRAIHLIGESAKPVN